MFVPADDDPGGDRGKIEESADRAAGLAMSANLEDLSEENKDGDHRGRLKIDRDLAVLGDRFRKDIGEKHDDRAEEISHPDPDADECKHVEMARAKGLPCADEEGFGTPDNDRGAEGELDPAGTIG